MVATRVGMQLSLCQLPKRFWAQGRHVLRAGWARPEPGTWRHDRAVDPVLLWGVGALAGGVLVMQPWPLMVAMLGGAWLVRRRARWWTLALAWLLCGLGATRARSRLIAADAQHTRAVAALSPPQRCDAVFDVLTSPVVLTPDDHRTTHRARIDVAIVAGRCGEALTPLPPGLHARLYRAPEEVTRGARLHGVIDVGAARRFDNPGARDPAVAEALRGVVASGAVLDAEVTRDGGGPRGAIDRARAHVRRRIERTFHPEVVRHARALVLGEYDMERREQHAFRVSGLAHLLAVSGTHLVLAVLAVGRLLRALLARWEWLARRIDVGRIAAAFSIVASWIYADFAGGGGSAYRAAAMLSMAMFARALGRRPTAVRAFAWSLLGGGLAEPLAAYDLSFGLSVAATVGLLSGASSGALHSSGWRRVVGWVVTAAKATLAANLACLPLLLSINPDVPLLGVAANVLAAPVGELAALPMCLAHSLVWWSGPVERGAAVVGSGALQLVRAVAFAAADSGWLVQLPPPTPWQLVTVFLVGAAVWLAGSAPTPTSAAALPTPRAIRRRRALIGGCGLVLVAGLEVAAMRAGAPPDVLRVTALDVAQGDAILIDLPDGRSMLIDGGGLVGSPIDTGERVVMEVLRTRRRRHLDVVVLTHAHPDHYGGLLTVLANVPVREVWMSGLALATRPTSQLSQQLREAAARGTRLVDARSLCREPRRFGRAEVTLLGPCPTFDTDASLNDNSMVLRLALDRRVAILTGDAESHQEQGILRANADLRADLLKVGHHGSRTSTTAPWLAAVRPSVAMISCGVRNRFGHPHEVTLEHLDHAGAVVLRTDRQGALLWQTDGEGVEWTTRAASSARAAGWWSWL